MSTEITESDNRNDQKDNEDKRLTEAGYDAATSSSETPSSSTNVSQEPIKHGSETAATSANGQIDYKMVTSENGEPYPQVVGYSSKKMMRRANQILTDQFGSNGCRPDARTSSRDTEFTITHAQNDIFSVAEKGSTYCGTAYPTTVDYTLTIDMRTGQEVEFTDLFANYERDKKEILNIIYEDVFAQAKASPSDQCSEVNTYDELSRRSHNYDFSSRSSVIHVRPRLPHAIQACTQEADVSLTELLPYVDDGSILQRIYDES